MDISGENNLSLTKRARGCLLGLACGDALGGPVEFMEPEDIRRKHGVVRDFIGGGWLSLRPGETTDDTAMALGLARSLVDLGRLDEQDIANRWVAWMSSDPKDIGNTIREALMLIADGTPWDEAGVLVDERAHGGALGNGSLMRCAPVAIAFRDDENELIRASRTTSRITHANPICKWSVVALNLIIAGLLKGEHERVISHATDLIPHQEIQAILRVGTKSRKENLNISGEVRATFVSAMWAYNNASSLEESVVEAVNLGGDSDTRGAVAGALAGARYGEDAIPNRWLERLEGREEIRSLADCLVSTLVKQRIVD